METLCCSRGRPLPLFEGTTCFSLYVGGAVLQVPHDSIGGKLCFANALFFFACLGVAERFFFTRRTCLHVEAVAVCMWKNAGLVFFSTRTAIDNAMQVGTSTAHSDVSARNQPSAAATYKQFWHSKTPSQKALKNRPSNKFSNMPMDWFSANTDPSPL
jgi:hypothetical protein